MPSLRRRYEPHEWVASPQKRSIDIAVAGAGSLPAIPLLGIAAITSTVLEKEPPFFVQEREGFPMLKLRTMPIGTPEMRAHDLPDSTITPYQQRIRRARLNELPQLANVLAGHMSIVGPRAQINVHREETLDNLTPPEQKA